MKLTSIILLLSLNSFAQVSVATIASLRKQTVGGDVTVRGYYKSGDGGGGQFTFDATDSSSDNGGTVVKSDFIHMGRFHRVVPNPQELNILWFGAKPDTITDSRDAIIRCRDALPKTIYLNNQNYFSQGTVIIDRGGFRSSDSIEFHGRVKLLGLGNGIGQRIEAQIWFDAGKGGLYFHQNGSFGTAFSSVENIAIIGRGTQGRLDKHGIFSSARIYITNIYTYNMPGDGVRIDSRYGGQPNLCVIRQLESYYNQGYGISFWGYDANQSSIYDINSHTNGLSNIHDESAHGNIYFAGHLSYAGIRQNWVRGFTKHNNKIYYCCNKNTGIEPGVTVGWDNYWVHSPTQIFDSTQYAKWNPDSTYYDALPIWAGGQVAKNTFYSTYCEGGQPSNWLGQYSIWYSASDGVGVIKSYMNKVEVSEGRYENVSGRGFYKRYLEDKNLYTGITDNEGFVAGSFSGLGRVSAKYNKTDSTLDWYGNGLPVPAWWMPGKPLINHPEYGRDTVASGTIVLGMYGFQASDMTDGGEGNAKKSKKVTIGFATKNPTSGKKYRLNSIFFNIGSDTTIVYWKNPTSPTIFIPIKSGN